MGFGDGEWAMQRSRGIDVRVADHSSCVTDRWFGVRYNSAANVGAASSASLRFGPWFSIDRKNKGRIYALTSIAEIRGRQVLDSRGNPTWKRKYFWMAAPARGHCAEWSLHRRA